jgi:hypothetical protein
MLCPRIMRSAAQRRHIFVPAVLTKPIVLARSLYSILLVILYQNIEFGLCNSGGPFLASWHRFYEEIISPDIKSLPY